MNRAYVDLPGGRVHYRYCGEGQPVVLIHMSGSSSDEFEQVGEYLKDRFAVYAIDLPGFGFSYKPEHYYSMIQYRDTVIDFIKALSLEKVILAGNLVGANVAARVAVECPELVKDLVLVQFIYNEDYAAFQKFRDLPSFSEVVPAADGSHLATFWSRACGASWNGANALPTDVLNARVLCMMLAGEYSEAMHWAIFEDEDYAGILPKIQTPTLVVALEGHSFAGVQPAVVKLLSNVQFLSLEGAGSYLDRIEPARYAAIISDRY